MSVSLALRARPLRARGRSSHGPGGRVKGEPDRPPREGVSGARGGARGARRGHPLPRGFSTGLSTGLSTGFSTGRRGSPAGGRVVHRLWTTRVFHRFFHRLWTTRGSPAIRKRRRGPPTVEHYRLRHPYGVPTVSLPDGVPTPPTIGSTRPVWLIQTEQTVQHHPDGATGPIYSAIQKASTGRQGRTVPSLPVVGTGPPCRVIHRGLWTGCGQPDGRAVEKPVDNVAWGCGQRARRRARAVGPPTGPHRAAGPLSGTTGHTGPHRASQGLTGASQGITSPDALAGHAGRAPQGAQGRKRRRGPRRGPLPAVSVSRTGGPPVPRRRFRWPVVVGALLAEDLLCEKDRPPEELLLVGVLVGVLADLADEGWLAGWWCWCVVHDRNDTRPTRPTQPPT